MTWTDDRLERALAALSARRHPEAPAALARRVAARAALRARRAPRARSRALLALAAAAAILLAGALGTARGREALRRLFASVHVFDASGAPAGAGEVPVDVHPDGTRTLAIELAPGGAARVALHPPDAATGERAVEVDLDALPQGRRIIAIEGAGRDRD